MNNQEAPLTPDVQPQITPEQPPVTIMPHETPPKRSLKGLVIIVVIVILVGALFLVYSSVGKREKTNGQRAISTSPTIQPTKPAAGQYTGSNSITLRDLSGIGYSGTAHRSIIENYFFRSIHANLPDPTEGQFYQVWIGNSQDEFIPIGSLYKDVVQRYSFVEGSEPETEILSFADMRNTIVISLESQDDGVMETKLLEGTFTQ